MVNVPDRTAELIEAARSLFMEKGFAKASMREIAARSGLTPMQSYRLGLAKEDLLAEVSIELTAMQLRTIAAKALRRPAEPLQAFVERYLLKLYKSDIRNIGIRRESAAYGWMWSAQYEERIVEQVLALLQPIAAAMSVQGLDNIAARCFTLWSLYYVGYRRAVVQGASASECLDAIRDSLTLALR
ncbi:MAG: TetR/AcrR family transcriptional regulator [Rhodoferax sp.]